MVHWSSSQDVLEDVCEAVDGLASGLGCSVVEMFELGPLTGGGEPEAPVPFARVIPRDGVRVHVR